MILELIFIKCSNPLTERTVIFFVIHLINLVLVIPFEIFIGPLTYDLWLKLSEDVSRTVGTIAFFISTWFLSN